MTRNVFGGFDRIRIINLPERTDRRREMERELARIGLKDDPRIAFVPGIRPADMAPFRARGEKGVFLSHLAILEEAAAAEESVLILEDDADFTRQAEIGAPLPTTGIAYGGYEAGDPDHLATSDIIGAHCMGIGADQVGLLAPYLRALLDHESPPPIDGAYVWYRRAHPEVPTYFAVPPVAVQRPSRSDIAGGKFFDDIPMVREIARLARRLKRRLKDQRGR